MSTETQRTPGARFGPYELLRPLGAGSGGEVWAAALHGPGGFRKLVALKMLPAGFMDSSLRGQLLEEARLGALLQHPNVISTLQVGVHDGTLCVALELVQGRTLRELLHVNDGPLSGRSVLEVGIQVAAALKHVHAFRVDGQIAGLIHRDVKPSNLMVDTLGMVKLADLGISMLQGQRSEWVAGTLGYMPVEQLEGMPQPRSDLFALAATLYELATGQMPFGKGKASILRVYDGDARLEDPGFRAPLDALVPGLGALICACLARDPGRRPRTARDMLDALIALQEACPPGQSLNELLAACAPELDVQTIRVSSQGSSLRPPSRPSTTSARTQTLQRVGNLEPSVDAFVGRLRELETLGAQLRSSRWTVILGPGGMGKTRLSLEAARKLQHDFPGGAWACDLTEARSELEICSALASMLRLACERDDPVAQMGRALASKGRCLILLDNLEQCVHALGATLGRWLKLAPDCHFLGTSQIRPSLAGERVLQLGELNVDEATALFQARASRSLSEEELGDVSGLCEALECMPLALELAAARLRLMTVAQMKARLSMALLSGGGRDLPERHRSVRASLDWSWSLLSDIAGLAMLQLSVFEGSFDLMAAEAVLDLQGEVWALDILQELVDASLIHVEPSTSRFWMRVVVREFCRARCAPEIQGAAERRHGEHYAQRAEADLQGSAAALTSQKQIREFAIDLENLVVACRRACARGDGAVAVATLNAASDVFNWQGTVGRFVELASLLERLELPPKLRASAICAFGQARFLNGEIPLARQSLEAAQRLARECGEPYIEAQAIWSMGTLCQHQGELDASLECFRAVLALAREGGRRGLEATILNNTATVLRRQGDIKAAKATYQQALEIHREVGQRRGEGIVLTNLGNIYLRLGRFDEALAYYEPALEIYREVGDRQSEGVLLMNLGSVRLSQKDYDGALELYEYALRFHQRTGDRRCEGVVQNNLGTLYDERGDIERSLEYHLAALKIHQELQNRHSEALSSATLGDIYRRMGDLDKAHAHLLTGERIYRKAGQPMELAMVLGWRVRCEVARGESDAALRLYEEARALSADIPFDHASDLGQSLSRAEACLAEQGLLPAPD